MSSRKQHSLHTEAHLGNSQPNHKRVQKANRGDEILAGLCDPGRILVFVDESGTSGKPLPQLAADFKLICGVVVASANYRCIKNRIQTILSQAGYGITELHATEIVNPNNQSSWRSVSPSVRIRSISSAIDVLAEYAEWILFCYVTQPQYDNDILHRIVAEGGPALTQEAALENVFFAGLFKYLRNTGQEVAIVADSKKSLLDVIQIQSVVRPHGIYQGGVINADSHLEEGLQIADCAAYICNRIHHIKQREKDGKTNCFDKVIQRGASKIGRKFINILDPVFR